MSRTDEHLEFHKGIDYAVVLRPGQTTDKPLASLYGIDRDVTRFGNLFAAAPDLLAALSEIRRLAGGLVDGSATDAAVLAKCFAIAGAAIAKAEGRS